MLIWLNTQTLIQHTSFYQKKRRQQPADTGPKNYHYWNINKDHNTQQQITNRIYEPTKILRETLKTRLKFLLVEDLLTFHQALMQYLISVMIFYTTPSTPSSLLWKILAFLKRLFLAHFTIYLPRSFVATPQTIKMIRHSSCYFPSLTTSSAFGDARGNRVNPFTIANPCWSEISRTCHITIFSSTVECDSRILTKCISGSAPEKAWISTSRSWFSEKSEKSCACKNSVTWSWIVMRISSLCRFGALLSKQKAHESIET